MNPVQMAEVVVRVRKGKQKARIKERYIKEKEVVTCL